jgi:hypothetical protein
MNYRENWNVSRIRISKVSRQQIEENKRKLYSCTMPAPPHLPNFDCFVSIKEVEEQQDRLSVDVSELEWMNEFNTMDTELNTFYAGNHGVDISPPSQRVDILWNSVLYRFERAFERVFGATTPSYRRASHFDHWHRIMYDDILDELSHCTFLSSLLINPRCKGSLAAYLQCDKPFRFRFPVFPPSVIQENSKRTGQRLRRLRARRFRFGE